MVKDGSLFPLTLGTVARYVRQENTYEQRGERIKASKVHYKGLKELTS